MSQHGRAVVLFDLGGVLVRTVGREALQVMLPHLSDAEITQRWTASRAVDRFERGQVAPNVFAREFLAEWQLRLSEHEFLDSFAGWVAGFFEGAKDVIAALRGDHLVACLSNTNAIHWARMKEVVESFEFAFASHLIGVMKPDPAAYRHVLRELQVDANKVYFLDDLAPNVAAARDVGMNAFQVSGFEDVKNILRSQGLYRERS